MVAFHTGYGTLHARRAKLAYASIGHLPIDEGTRPSKGPMLRQTPDPTKHVLCIVPRAADWENEARRHPYERPNSVLKPLRRTWAQ